METFSWKYYIDFFKISCNLQDKHQPTKVSIVAVDNDNVRWAMTLVFNLISAHQWN